MMPSQTSLARGYSHMTNVRILLDVKTGGFFSKTTEIKLDKALGTIKTVSAPGGKQLQIQFEGSVEPTNDLCCKRREMGSGNQKCIDRQRQM